MTLAVEKLSISDSQPAAEPSAQGQMLLRVFQVLEEEAVHYCVLHGYGEYPTRVPSDVDLLIPKGISTRRLAQILHSNRHRLGAQIVQWFDDGAIFIVLAADQEHASPPMLQLHVSRNYAMAGRIFLSGEQIIQSRQRRGSFWVPAPAMEFAGVLINRICKNKLSDEHADRLSILFSQDPTGCSANVDRFVSAETARLITNAAKAENWERVRRLMPILRRELLHSRNTKADAPLAGFARRVRRWIRPKNGLHVVFLGPDGVGKSTVIETFQRDLEHAFLRSAYMTFAPSLIPAKLAPKKSTPHELPPRSLPASYVKAAWWLICYTFGYFASVHTILARGGLVVNHRYLIDAIVDQKRYRYSGPVRLLRWIWAIAPKPDLVLLLDAPPEVIRKRKSELPIDEIAKQRERYRAVVTPLAYGHVINAAQPLEKVIADAEGLVLNHLARRVERRLAPGGHR